MKKLLVTLNAVVAIVLLSAFPAYAITLINGDFEEGTLNGWTVTNNANVTNTGSDPILSSIGYTLPMVYEGDHAARVNDEFAWGPFGGPQSSQIAQSAVVDNLTEHLYFAWTAVLMEPSNTHPLTDRPWFRVQVYNDTQATTPYGVTYYAADASDPAWTNAGFYNVSVSGWNASGNLWTRPWQVVDLNLPAYGVNLNDTITISLFASDCDWQGHFGYAYIDGFGTEPPGPVPEPATMILLGSGLLGLAAFRKKRS